MLGVKAHGVLAGGSPRGPAARNPAMVELCKETQQASPRRGPCAPPGWFCCLPKSKQRLLDAQPGMPCSVTPGRAAFRQVFLQAARAEGAR